MSIVMETPLKLKFIVDLLESQLAAQRTKKEIADEHPIVNAVDRAHAQGAEMALLHFKNTIMEVVISAHETLQEKRA